MPPDDGDYWSTHTDPYINPDTDILKNIPDLKTQDALDRFEAMVFHAQAEEASAYCEAIAVFTLDHWRALHRICFADIYDWAGALRTVRIAKGHTVFCYPENIESQSAKLFQQINDALADKSMTIEKMAELFAEINLIHPFREGNGRTQRFLFSAIAARAGYHIDYTMLDKDRFIQALIDAVSCDYDSIKKIFYEIVGDLAL